MGDTQKLGGPNKKGILLICFSPETLGALVSILRQNGESTLTPPSIQDAWACVKQDVVGCVILDLTGPAAEALAFFRACRSSQKSCAIPFLFLCGSQEEVLSLGRWGVEFAADDWLVLPSPADEFISKTRGLIEQNKAARVAGSFGPVRAGSSSMGLQKVADKPATPAMKSSAGAPAVHDGAARSSAARAAVGGALQPDELLKLGGAFYGRLGVLDCTKIIGMVEPLRLSGVLSLTDGKRMGNIYFIDGAVRHAELHDIEGADALFLLFHLKNGAFRFEHQTACPRRTIEGNTMALLLEGLRQMDEAKAIIKTFQQNRTGSSAAEPPKPVGAGE